MWLFQTRPKPEDPLVSCLQQVHQSFLPQLPVFVPNSVRGHFWPTQVLNWKTGVLFLLMWVVGLGSGGADHRGVLKQNMQLLFTRKDEAKSTLSQAVVANQLIRVSRSGKNCHKGMQTFNLHLQMYFTSTSAHKGNDDKHWTVSAALTVSLHSKSLCQV